MYMVYHTSNEMQPPIQRVVESVCQCILLHFCTAALLQCCAILLCRYCAIICAIGIALCQMLADDWTSLGEVQYRKIPLYNLDWGGDENRQLDRNVVAVAKYGGAVAMMRDETKLLKVKKITIRQRQYSQYSCHQQRIISRVE